MKVAIVGSRRYPSLEEVVVFVNGLAVGTIVVTGGAKGVDATAESAARYQGLEVIVFAADWKRYGKWAGFRRNKEIVDAADMVVAFWDGVSNGTEHTIDLALVAKKPVEIYLTKDIGCEV